MAKNSEKTERLKRVHEDLELEKRARKDVNWQQLHEKDKEREKERKIDQRENCRGLKRIGLERRERKKE